LPNVHIAVRKKVAEGTAQILSNGLSTGREYAYSVNSWGKQVNGIPEGGEDYCDLEPFSGSLNTVLIHNHPSSNSFSPEDVGALYGLGAGHLIVAGHDGTIYRLSKTTDSFTAGDIASRTNVASSIPDVQEAFMFQINQDYDQSVLRYMDRFFPRVKSGELSPAEASKQHGHMVVQDLARLYKLDYQRIEPR
jgi:hypothetical protein